MCGAVCDTWRKCPASAGPAEHSLILTAVKRQCPQGMSNVRVKSLGQTRPGHSWPRLFFFYFLVWRPFSHHSCPHLLTSDHPFCLGHCASIGRCRGAPVPDALNHIAVSHLSGCLCHDKSYHCTIKHRVTKRYVRVIRGNYTERNENLIRPGLHAHTVRCNYNSVLMHFCHTSNATKGVRCLRVCVSLRAP